MKEEDFNLEEEYNKIRSKLNLPNFNVLNNEFEISEIGETKFLLRNIRRRMCEKLADFCDFLEGFIYPHSATLANFYELKFIDDNEKEKIINIFKKLMILTRKDIRLDVESNDNEEAKFILEIYGMWIKVKADLLSFANLIENSWTKKDNIPTNEGYFG